MMFEQRRLTLGDFLKPRTKIYSANSPEIRKLQRISKISFEGELVVGDHKHTKTNQIIVYPNDLVFSGLNIEKGAISINETEKQLAVSTNYNSLEVDYKLVDRDFLKFFLISPYFKDTLIENLPRNYSFTRPNKLLPIKVNIPDIVTQRRIANYLQRILLDISHLVSEISHQSQLLQNLRQAVLQEAIEGKLTAQWRKEHPDLISGENHASKLLEKIKSEKERMVKEGKFKKEKPLPPITDDEKPFDLPEGWVWCRWADLLSFDKHSMKRGPFGSSLRKNDFVKKGIRVFEQYNPINDDPYWARYYISEERFEDLKSFLAGPGDLLISCSGATLGRITEIPNDAEEGIINQALLKLTLHKELISNLYFKLLFRSIYMQRKIFGMAWGVAIPNMIGVSEIKKILIPLPPTSEQNFIIEYMNKLGFMINGLEKQVSECKDQSEMLMRAVLREAFEQ